MLFFGGGGFLHMQPLWFSPSSRHTWDVLWVLPMTSEPVVDQICRSKPMDKEDLPKHTYLM